MGRSDVKGQPFSIRLSAPTDEFVTSEAERTQRSKSAVVEALTEEATRMRRFPGIAFRGDDAARRPWLVGTGLDVWQVVEAAEDFDSEEEMAEATDLDLRHIRLAMRYRDQYPDEVDAAVHANREDPHALQRRYPFLDLAPLA